jgi:hypothetical protein
LKCAYILYKTDVNRGNKLELGVFLDVDQAEEERYKLEVRDSPYILYFVNVVELYEPNQKPKEATKKPSPF